LVTVSPEDQKIESSIRHSKEKEGFSQEPNYLSYPSLNLPETKNPDLETE
jgi:hypothetical protein